MKTRVLSQGKLKRFESYSVQKRPVSITELEELQYRRGDRPLNRRLLSVSSFGPFLRREEISLMPFSELCVCMCVCEI